MSGRFDGASDPTDRTMSRLKDAIRGEAGKPTNPEGSPQQPHDCRSPRKVETVLVIVAASVMIGAFILLVIWLR